MAARYLASAQKAIRLVANHPALKNYNTTVLSPLKVVSATDEGVIKFNWEVNESHLTPGGRLHGGLTAGGSFGKNGLMSAPNGPNAVRSIQVLTEVHFFTNGTGIIDLTHGIGILAISECTQSATTIELNINYMRYVTNSEILDIESRVTKQGSRIAFMETTIMDSKGSIIATGKQTAMLVKVSEAYDIS